MSSFKPQHQSSRAKVVPPRRAGRRVALGAALAAAAVAAGFLLALTLSGGGSSEVRRRAPPGADHGDASLPAGYRLTDEVSAMGGRVIEPPATRSGAAAAGGVVANGADVELGHIPLAFAVNPVWTLRNTGDAPVTLGVPKVVVVEGCCPSEPVLAATTLAPGESTTLNFPSQMHEGMDGEHLFRILVPVSGAVEPLTLSLSAHFD